MAVKRGPAKASACPAGWRWQLICAAVGVAAGACFFASGAPPLPGLYIDEAYVKALADSCVKEEYYDFEPALMEQDRLFGDVLRYLCHCIPGLGDAAMEQFRVGAECPSDPEQQDVAIRLYEIDWAKNYLAARPQLEPLINYSIAIREEELELLTKIIFHHMDKKSILKAPDIRLRQRPRCIVPQTDAFTKEVEARLGRHVTRIHWPFPRDSANEPKDLPDGIDSWIDYFVHQLPNGLFDVAIESHVRSDSTTLKQITLRYTAVYSFTPQEGPIPQQRFKLTEIYHPDFANYSNVPGRGDWEATRNYHNTWDGNSVTVKNKSEKVAYKGHSESAITEKSYTWRKGNDIKANKFKENMTGKVTRHFKTADFAPARNAILDITREKSFDDGQDERFRVERLFDLDPIPARFRMFYREEPKPESGTKALHCGLFIHPKSPQEPTVLASKPTEWSTLGSTFALEITTMVKKIPKYNNPSVFEEETISTDLRIAAQTGPNKRFLHIGKLVEGKKWEYDTLMYEENPEMTSSTRRTELKNLMLSDEPDLRKAEPELARRLGIDESHQGFGGTAAIGEGISRNDPGRRYDQTNFSLLGKLCTGATLYLVADRLLASHATPSHSRLAKVGGKTDWYGAGW